MLTRALAQNLAIIGMLSTLQEVRRVGDCCECEGEYLSGCGCGREVFDVSDDAMGALGEQQWGYNKSATRKEIYGQ